MKNWIFACSLVLTATVISSPAALAHEDDGAKGRAVGGQLSDLSERQRREIREYYRGLAAEQGGDEDREEGRAGKEGKYKGKDKGEKHKGQGGKHKDKGAQHSQRTLPKGLQKKLARGGSLPPGWERKLKEGEPLSSEMRANSEPLPADLEQILDPSGDVAEIIRIQDKVVRVSRGEGTIIDVVDLVEILEGAGVFGGSN